MSYIKIYITIYITKMNNLHLVTSFDFKSFSNVPTLELFPNRTSKYNLILRFKTFPRTVSDAGRPTADDRRADECENGAGSLY